MPGLVGAILRSGGYYAAMRSQISHEEKKITSNKRSAKITLKLLNIIAKELGSSFLQQGIWLNGLTVHEFIERYLDGIKTGFIAGELNGKLTALKDLQIIAWNADQVLLQVSSDEPK